MKEQKQIITYMESKDKTILIKTTVIFSDDFATVFNEVYNRLHSLDNSGKIEVVHS